MQQLHCQDATGGKDAAVASGDETVVKVKGFSWGWARLRIQYTPKPLKTVKLAQNCMTWAISSLNIKKNNKGKTVRENHPYEEFEIWHAKPLATENNNALQAYCSSPWLKHTPFRPFPRVILQLASLELEKQCEESGWLLSYWSVEGTRDTLLYSRCYQPTTPAAAAQPSKPSLYLSRPTDQPWPLDITNWTN